ncbi:MAG TPA: type II secretion system protein [Acidimicrobiales bacterium]|nr:type II secretion system protein [Acidimicrobiales bacterium]
MSGRSDRGAARGRRPPGPLEEGFTVLELVVVVSIIALVMSVAAPTFNAARSTAQEHAAQSNLRTALVAANTAYITTPDQSFSFVTPASLQAAEPSLKWAPTQQTSGPGTIAALNGQVAETGDWALGLATDAGDGTCWYAFQSDNASPMYGWARKQAPSCDAADAWSNASQTQPPDE